MAKAAVLRLKTCSLNRDVDSDGGVVGLRQRDVRRSSLQSCERASHGLRVIGIVQVKRECARNRYRVTGIEIPACGLCCEWHKGPFGFGDAECSYGCAVVARSRPEGRHYTR